MGIFGIVALCSDSVIFPGHAVGDMPYAAPPRFSGSVWRQAGVGSNPPRMAVGRGARFVKGQDRMIRLTGVVRRLLLVTVGLSAVGLGWVLLFKVTSPGVAARLATGPLAAVIALQVLPVLAWAAWRIDRGSQAHGVEEQPIEQPVPEAALVEQVPAASQPVAERPRVRNDQVMPVHRVTHMPRTRTRTVARATDQAVAG